jgi:DNA-binding PadR family transcriptional regulator
LLLALLDEKPSHGYELIKALEERSGGFYSPSPGMIYPALQYLEEVGFASVTADGAKKLYSITSEGREYLDKHREIAEAILDQMSHVSERVTRIREFFGDEDESRESRDVRQARRELKQALREKRAATGEEASRIAEILRRATASIRGKS